MKKKILHILNSTSYSGAENVVCSIIEQLKEFDQTYVSRDGKIREVLQKRGISFCLKEKLTVRELKKMIQEYQPDLIHAHDFTAGILVACTKPKVPVISHLHNNPGWIKSYGLKSLVYYIASKKADKVLAVSEAIFKEYVFGNQLQKKGIVCQNPINLEYVRQEAEKMQAPQTSILFLGRLTEQKNPRLFVDIVIACEKKMSGVTAVMIGDGELRQDIENYIIEKGMSSKIKLLGFMENPYTYLNATKVLCMPSSWEGFGLVAVEALALGKPVVAGRVGGLVDIVTDLCGKMCVNKDDYVEEIIKLLSEETYYVEKSKNSVERAEFLEKKIDYFNGMRRIYRELLESMM